MIFQSSIIRRNKVSRNLLDLTLRKIHVEAKLTQLGFVLAEKVIPKGSYVPFVIVRDITLLYI